MGCFKNNLIAYKLQYFLNFGGLACSSPFLQVFARQLGLGQVSVGWIFTAAPFVDLFVRPMVCALADRRQATWTTFLLVFALTTGSLTALRWVPPLSTSPTASQHLSVRSFNSSVAREVNVTAREIAASDDLGFDMTPIPTEATGKNPSSEDKSVHSDMEHYQFWVFSFLLLMAWTGVSTNQTMFDGITAKSTEILGADYGRQRLFGTIGYSSMVVLSGYLLDIVGNEEEVAYRVGFYLTASLMTANFFLCLFFIKPPALTRQQTSFSQLGSVVRQWPVVVFATCCMLIGVSTGLLWSFRIWYLDDIGGEAGYSKSRMKLLQGLTYLVRGAVCEIPLMFVSGSILKKIGYKFSMTLSVLLLGVYLIVYSRLVNPWMCLLAEPLAGAAFGLMYPTIAAYACSLAPRGTAVTTQAVMAASYDGLGVGVGTIVSSYLYDKYGGRTTFFCFGLAAIFSAVWYLFTSFLIDRHFKPNVNDQEESTKCGTFADHPELNGMYGGENPRLEKFIQPPEQTAS